MSRHKTFGNRFKKIKEWIDVYKKTYGPDFKDVDINSESMIIFCGIMQAFCGYYTTKNLLDKEILREYLKLNGSKLKNKIAVIKINTKIFNDHHWHTDIYQSLLFRIKAFQTTYRDLMALRIPYLSPIKKITMITMNFYQSITEMN